MTGVDSCHDLYLSEFGYQYIPDACRQVGSSCNVHMVLHGCWLSWEVPGVGTGNMQRLGMLEVADAYSDFRMS